MLSRTRRAKRLLARAATPRHRLPRLQYRHHITLLLCAIAILIRTPPSSAWDSATHRAIARLAVEALPPSPLKETLAHNEAALETHSVEPDSVLKKRYGKAEDRRHYIDSEYFGSNPWPALDADFSKMQRRFGEHRVARAGTLPWTVEAISDQLENAWHRGDCEAVIRLSGYLAHYVGDASQPLHSTIHFDGYPPRDRGMHARIELAVDHSLGELEPVARNEIRVEDINDVWTPVVAEIRDAHGFVGAVIRDDRAAREAGDYSAGDYRHAVMNDDRAMFARQIARAASVVASIWVYEWRRAGSPSSCSSK